MLRLWRLHIITVLQFPPTVIDLELVKRFLILFKASSSGNFFNFLR